MLTASRVADEHRHAHAGGRHLDLGIEDLLGLGHHLPFLARVAVLHEDVDVGNAVEGDLLGELLGLDLLARHVLALGLGPQLVHGVLAGAGDGLIGRHHHALDGGAVVQGLQRHHQLHGRAVGVGDDVLLGVAGHRVGVHLGHDQRHVLVVAPGRGVIDDDAALGGDLGRPLLGHRAAGRHQAEVDLGEVEGLQVLAFERCVAERDLHADRAARRQRVHLVDGELALGSGSTAFPGPRCPWRRRRRRCSSWLLCVPSVRVHMHLRGRACNRSRAACPCSHAAGPALPQVSRRSHNARLRRARPEPLQGAMPEHSHVTMVLAETSSRLLPCCRLRSASPSCRAGAGARARG